jgi:hypothetical protein
VAGTITRPLGRLRYAGRASLAIAAQPYEGIERTLERVAESRDARRDPWPYTATEACEERLHAMLGACQGHADAGRQHDMPITRIPHKARATR